MNDFIPFAPPDIGEEEIAEVVDSLRRGWITTGAKTRLFEEKFAEFLGGTVETIAVNSATAGLHLALEAIGIGPGDEVILPTLTFTATAEVVRYLGADPVLVDVDESTLCIDPHCVESAISPRTKAIIPVHYAGLACNMDAIFALTKNKGIAIIEDAAHAIPTTYRGKLIGQLPSRATVFSFYATKPLTTGEGGMIVTSDLDLAKRCRIMRLHGINRDAFDRYTSNSPGWRYEVIAPGFKYNLTDLASSIGIHQLRKVYELHHKRANIFAKYSEAFKNLPLMLPTDAKSGSLHSYHLYVIRLLDKEINRDRLIDEFYRHGISCSVHYIPLHLHPYWKDRYALSREQFPIAQRAYEHMLSLPIFSSMTEQQQMRVVEVVRAVLGYG